MGARPNPRSTAPSAVTYDPLLAVARGMPRDLASERGERIPAFPYAAFTPAIAHSIASELGQDGVTLVGIAIDDVDGTRRCYRLPAESARFLADEILRRLGPRRVERPNG